MRTPATLALLAIIGAVLVFAGLLWILGQAHQWFQCAAGVTPIPTSCVSVGPLVGAAGLVVVGAIVYVVGLIGIWLGLWRLGTRYNTSLFKIGMVLIIFPFLDIVGFILIIVAARDARSRAMARGKPAGT